MSKEILHTFDKQVLETIYENVFKHIVYKHLDIFLCGGVSTGDYISVRDEVRDNLKDNDKLRILYPEDLFIELLNTNKSYDLLKLEQFLAENCDNICIICESAGSLVELGAFTNNEYTADKVIAVVEEKRKRNKSFIMLGPIKTINNINSKHVIYYSKANTGKLSDNLNKLFNSKMYSNIRSKNNTRVKDINTITGLYDFILLLLYFYGETVSERLAASIKYILKNYLRFELESFDVLYISSLKLLFKDRCIEKEGIKKPKKYKLTEKGYEKVSIILGATDIYNRTKLYDRIRFDIIKSMYYRNTPPRNVYSKT